MRHRKKIAKLSRTSSHRRALMANLASSLILHKKIKTTAVKAKALRPYIEKLITKARKADLAARRLVLKHITRKDIVKELFDDVAPRYTDTPGGYTRVTKIGQRLSDSTEMAFIELIGYEGDYKKKKETQEQDRKKRKEKKEQEEKEAQDAAMEQQALAAETAEPEPAEKEEK